MNKTLSANNLRTSKTHFYLEFQILLSKIVDCYKIMITNNITVPRNNENEIRDRIVSDYLRKTKYKRLLGLEYFEIDKETSEDYSDKNSDIRIKNKNLINDDDSKAYYLIECKHIENNNINGKTGLNGKYIENGILRFIKDNYYSTYYALNGMIGFVIDEMDIHKNIENINNVNNKFFTESNTQQELEQSNFIKDFDFQYSSKHKTNKDKNIILYHLMLDFLKNLI